MSLTVKVCPTGTCRFYLQLSLDPLALDKNLTVYRFSLQKMLQLLQTKVARLSTPEFAKATRSINRSLAKDGLGPDETVSEDLRQGPSFLSLSLYLYSFLHRGPNKARVPTGIPVPAGEHF